MCSLAVPWPLTHPHTMLTFELCPDRNPEFPFPLWPGGHEVHDFQRQSKIWTHQIKALFSTLYQILSELGQWHFWVLLMDGFHSAWWSLNLHLDVVVIAHTVVHKVVKLLVNDWAFRGWLFTPINGTGLFPINQFTSLVAPVSSFLECVAGIKFKMRGYLQKPIRFISLSLKYFVFVV